ncbi:MAG: type II methionyl aminopeptidase [Euryarchaeota archaeon]|nr:type II methionyl aminopeptidase [Euryarchaeota archaeon]
MARFQTVGKGPEADPKEKLEKHRRAGRILREVREEARGLIQPGRSLLEVADFVEGRIREKGAQPAFPCNISRNTEAAHYTPAPGDTLLFGNDIVKLDMGVHVDGYIADAAITVDHSDHPELVQAAEKALQAAIGVIHAGVSTAEVGAAIQGTIEEFGVKPVANLTGHGLGHYTQHDEPAIPNRRVTAGTLLKAGDTIAIEPFATNGAGRVKDGPVTEIYMLTDPRPVRLPSARSLQADIQRYKGLPFARRWLKGERIEMGLRQLEVAGALYRYPVLVEAGGGLVAQFEHSVIVTENGCEVFT